MYNLLSQNNKEILIQGYKKRFLITLNWSLFFAFIVSTILLMPVFIANSSKSKEIRKKSELNLNVVNSQKDLLSLATLINSRSSKVLAFKDATIVISRIKEITSLASTDKNISISDIEYSQVTEEDKSKIVISGVSRNRQSLINLEKSLKEVSFIENVSLPVTSFVKDTDLPFSINILISK